MPKRDLVSGVRIHALSEPAVVRSNRRPEMQRGWNGGGATVRHRCHYAAQRLQAWWRFVGVGLDKRRAVSHVRGVRLLPARPRRAVGYTGLKVSRYLVTID